MSDDSSEGADNVITARGVSKSFGPTRALADVNFTLRAGEIHALLGGNGAGKSTLIKILSGALEADDGELKRDTSEIAVVHQELALLKDLTVAENIALGSGRKSLLFPWKGGSGISARILATLGISAEVAPEMRAGDLALHKQQLVEIGRALATGAQVILLDEPTAVLTSSETDTLFEVLRRLRDGGISFIFVSHRMAEIRRIADRMTILREGRTVVDGRPVAEIADADVLADMFGETLRSNDADRRRSVAVGSPVLELARGTKTVTLHEGEVLGLSGVPIGPQSVINAVLGLSSGIAWDVTLLREGRRRSIRSTRAAILQGIGYVSGDRKEKGLFPALSVYENVLTSRYLAERRIARRSSDTAVVERLAARLGFGNQNLHGGPQALSGGTQQKLLIARWLDLDMRLLILEEPTRGVDLRTKEELYSLVAELALRGCAVLWWSTEWTELQHSCDRVMAFTVSGDLAGVVPVATATEVSLLELTGTA